MALVDGAKSALGALAFVALGVSSQGSHDFTEMLTILTLVREPPPAAAAAASGWQAGGLVLFFARGRRSRRWTHARACMHACL